MWKGKSGRLKKDARERNDYSSKKSTRRQVGLNSGQCRGQGYVGGGNGWERRKKRGDSYLRRVNLAKIREPEIKSGVSPEKVQAPMGGGKANPGILDLGKPAVREVAWEEFYEGSQIVGRKRGNDSEGYTGGYHGKSKGLTKYRETR